MRVSVSAPTAQPKVYPTVPHTNYAVSLFSGGGGSTIGLDNSGYTIVASIDKDADSCATLQLNGYSSLHADLRTFDYSVFHGIDLVEGGPPCQPFSQAGLQLGKDDLRDCIPDFVRAVTVIHPRVFVMENVKALTYWTHESYLWDVIDSFPREYEIEYRVLNAADYGVPQKRQRLFIVGRLDGEPQWPTPTHFKDGVNGDKWVSMAEALGIPTDSIYISNYKKGNDPDSRSLVQADEGALTVTSKHGWFLQPGLWADLVEPSPTIMADNDQAAWKWIFDRPATTVVGSFNPEIIAAPAFLKAGGLSRQNQPGSIEVTVQQRAILQGFPSTWQFVGNKTSQSRQVGNACPPQLIEAVVRANK